MNFSHISINDKMFDICQTDRKRSITMYNSDIDGKNVMPCSCIDVALNRKYQKSDKKIISIDSEKNRIFELSENVRFDCVE